MSSTMSHPQNQAMEPVGIGAGALTGHDVHREAPKGPQGLPPSNFYAPFRPKEIAGAVALIGYLVVLCAVWAAMMIFGDWAIVGLFRVLGASLPAAELWGNAIANILFVVLAFVMLLATLLTMGERKWSAFIQDRIGPNRARLPGLKNHAFWGIPHILADVGKMMTKEEVVPAMGNQTLFHLAPAIAFAPAVILFAVIPLSPDFTLWGEHLHIGVAPHLNQGLLYIFAIASIGVLGTSLGGWASNNKYGLLGAMRASAQMISYEVTLGLTLVGLMLIFGTLRLDSMMSQQTGHLFGFLPNWGVFYQPLAIVAYFAAASAEIKRAPFDLPEGDSEIVGYFIEYSGLKFGIYMIGEFVEVVVFAGLFTTLFFGGYHLPWGEGWLAGHLGPTWLAGLQVLTFLAKTVFFCWLSLAVRWTYPRFRYDQVMNLGWKLLLPASIANVALTGVVILAGGMHGAAIMGIVELVILLAWVVGAVGVRRSGKETLLPTESAAASEHG